MKYLIIGDIMIDRYVIGEVNKISQEAPIPIIDVKYQYDVLGGAANCARNIATIAPDAIVDIIGYIGKDNDGDLALSMLDEEVINFIGWRTFRKPTIVKERVIVQGQQVVRMDLEDKKAMLFNKDLFDEVALEEYDIIIVSDYAKGTVNRVLMDYLTPFAHKLIIDPKPENWSMYPDSTYLITPNEKEYRQIVESEKRPRNLLVTKGKEGMSLMHFKSETLNEDAHGTYNILTETIPNCEVIGAGDVVVAVIAVTKAITGYDLKNCCIAANECAKWVVTQPGTSVISKDVYENVLAEMRGDNF